MMLGPPRSGRQDRPERREQAAMSVGRKNKNKDADLAKQLVAGIGKHLATAPSITVGSETLTPAELTQRLQTLVNLRTAVNDAKVTTKAHLAAEASQSTPLIGLMTEFRAYLKAAYSKSPDVLADFGLTPK